MLSYARIKTLCNVLALSTVVVGLAGCGGGGSGGSNSGDSSSSLGIIGDGKWQLGVFNAADNYANKCEAPRTGIDPGTKKPYPDMLGSTLDENNYLRSWSNDTYLWYSEIEDQDPSTFSSPLEYFDTLRTWAETPSGRYKDNFHYTYPTAKWDDLLNSGEDTGYGIAWASLPSTTNPRSRNYVVSYTEPGSPGAASNLLRGTKLLKVDGIDFLYSDNSAALDKGLYPTNHNETHIFEVLDPGASVPRTIQLTSRAITKVPVQNVKILNTSSGNVGYFLFNDHLATAEQGLISAIDQLKQGNITDLVLDVRYNGGGYLYIASQLAYMIAGFNATDNKVFEMTTFNDKHRTRGLFGERLEPMGFFSVSEDGYNLPSLNLPRVFIITTGNTCSASEAIINGLRGVNVEVIQIGSQTCGKPYGFYGSDNCGTTYLTIQFKGVNNKGFGEYADGFVPSAIDNGQDNIKGCDVGDDFTHQLGDKAELNLAAALHYRERGQCPTSLASDTVRLQKLSDGDNSNVRATLHKEPVLNNRIMR